MMMFKVNFELLFIIFIFIIYFCVWACFANFVNYINFFNVLFVFAGQRSPPKFAKISTISHHSFLKPIKIIPPTSSRPQSPSRPSSQTSFFALASGTQIVTTSAHISGCIRLTSAQSAHQMQCHRTQHCIAHSLKCFELRISERS